MGALVNVWGGDDATHFEESLRSIVNQTQRTSELFVVADGPLSAEIELVLSQYEAHITELLRHGESLGLAHGRNTGLKAMRSDFVMLQDADDVSHPQRVEVLSRALGDSLATPVVTSSPMVEFASTTRRLLGLRPGPKPDQPLSDQLRRLNPINHPTAVLHRESFLLNGPYVPLHRLEDYATWASLTRERGLNFAIISTPMVAFRVTDDYFRRRGGWELMRSEYTLQSLLRRALPKPMRPATRLSRFAYTAAPAFARGMAARAMLTELLPSAVGVSLDEFLARPSQPEEFRILPHPHRSAAMPL